MGVYKDAKLVYCWGFVLVDLQAFAGELI